MFTETKMTTQTALATSPATLASNEEKINRHARTHFRSCRRGVEACSTPRGGGDNNNLYKKMPKPMLHKLGSSVRKHLEVRERQREKKTKTKTLALQKHRPNEERRG